MSSPYSFEHLIQFNDAGTVPGGDRFNTLASANGVKISRPRPMGSMPNIMDSGRIKFGAAMRPPLNK